MGERPPAGWTPDRLSDLDGAEADVRVTCRRCGWEEDWDVEALSGRLRRTGGDEAWGAITAKLRCRRIGCGGRDLHAAAVPIARRPANAPRGVRALDAALIDLAMRVLTDAAYRQSTGPVRSPEVRLALYVVHGYARARHLVESYWRSAAAGGGGANTPRCHDDLNAIRRRLERTGWLLLEPRIERDRTWPWDGSPPEDWTGDVSS